MTPEWQGPTRAEDQYGPPAPAGGMFDDAQRKQLARMLMQIGQTGGQQRQGAAPAAYTPQAAWGSMLAQGLNGFTRGLQAGGWGRDTTGGLP
jgi:hypothetical protein